MKRFLPPLVVVVIVGVLALLVRTQAGVGPELGRDRRHRILAGVIGQAIGERKLGTRFKTA